MSSAFFASPVFSGAMAKEISVGGTSRSRKALEDKGYTFLSADIAMVPQNYISLTDEGDLKNMQKLIDMLEDNDDVQNVWHNWENE